MSDVARNIELVERLERAYNERDYDTVRASVAADFVPHTAGSERVPPGVEGAIAANEGSFQASPDRRTEILEIFGDGDRVVSHVRHDGHERRRDRVRGRAGQREVGRLRLDPDLASRRRWDDPGDLGADGSAKLMVQIGAMPAPEGM